MAGIFGCFRFREGRDLSGPANILRQSAGFGLGADMLEGSRIRGNIHFGYTMPPKSGTLQCLFQSSDGNYSLLLFGEFFLPSGEELSALNFESEFLPGFQRSGNDFFLQCDGAFILALYDDVKRSLLLVTDPFGNLALHYTMTDDLFLFSSRQGGLAEALGEKVIDEALFAEMIGLGQLLDGRTLWKNIHRIQPATCMTVKSSGNISIEKYYTPDYSEKLQGRESLGKIEDEFLRSVDIRLNRKQVICGLTGGMDSRITLAAIKRLGRIHEISTFTHGLPDSGDMKIAERLSAYYHIPHLEVRFDERLFAGLPNYWRDVVWQSEGAIGIENAANIISWKKQAEEFTVLMDSHGGPLYRRQILKSREGLLARAGNFAEAIFKLFSSPLLRSSILRPGLREVAANAARTAIGEYFSQLPKDLSVGDRIDRFYLEQMSANRYSLSGNAQMNFIGLSHPLLSLKAYDAVTHIPAGQRKANVIYKYLFNRFAPELKRFTVDNSGFQVPYYGYRYLRYLPHAWDRGLLKLPRYFRRFSVRKPIATVEILTAKNFGALKELLLTPDPKVQHYFDLLQIEKELSDFESGRKDNFALLTQAANLRLVLELFG